MRQGFAKWEIQNSVFSKGQPQAGNCWILLGIDDRRLPMRTRIRPWVEALESRALLNAGDLDPTFGGIGEVTTQVGVPISNGPWAVVVQPDLKVVVAGFCQGTSHKTNFNQ